MKKSKYLTAGFLIISFCLFWAVACNAGGMGGGHHGGNYNDHHGSEDYRGGGYNDHRNEIGGDHGYRDYDGQRGPGSENQPPYDHRNGVDRDKQRSPQNGTGPDEETNGDRP